MTDLNNHALVPLDHLAELETAAYGHNPTASERAASVLQSTFVFAGLGAAVVATTYGCTWVADKLEQRRLDRMIALQQFEIDNKIDTE